MKAVARLLACGILAAALGPARAETSGVEIWIASRPQANGDGSQAHPFDGSTLETFDELMQRSPEAATIHLGPGTFRTRGIHLKNAWHLQGSGIERTTIRLADGLLRTGGPTAAYVLSNHDTAGFYDSIVISDLTIDCNREHQPLFRSGGPGNLIALTTACRNARIRRVRAVGTWADPGEGFPFSVISAGSSDGSNRVEIDSCESISPVGNMTAISAFDQSGGGRLSGFIRGCRVINGPNAVGFGSGGWKDFVVRENVTHNVNAGIVIDTHAYENVVIERNHFYGTRRWGIVYNGAGLYRDIVVRNNYVEMTSRSAEWCLLTSEAHVTTRIERNEFVQNSRTRPAFWIGANTAGIIRDNVVDSRVPGDIAASPQLLIHGNRNKAGKPLRLIRR